MTDKSLRLLQEKFPFLTLFEYSEQEGICLIQNYGRNVCSAYVYNQIKDQELKRKFIELAEVWWNESNRKIPINLFFKQDFDIFSPYVINFITKEFKIVSGHSVSLQNLTNKRIKRKRVELIVRN